ncbi:MAG: class I SAM-dependent methyltransferase [Anaerolineales bacterium]
MAGILAHPLTRGLEIDDPRTTELRRRIIAEKQFLRRIYADWYATLAVALPSGPGAVLELGSGAGFLSQFIPDLITSEYFFCSGIRAVLDGKHLPFADGCLRGILMTDVLHHLPRPRLFLAEAARCVRPGGVVAMVEPWVSAWSRLIYTRLHHEPFSPTSPDWEFPERGPLSGANGALPWMIFERDRLQFEQEFPQWRIERVNPIMPFRYLVSGGVSMRTLMPGFTYRFWQELEKALQPHMPHWGMFAEINLRRQNVEPASRKE